MKKVFSLYMFFLILLTGCSVTTPAVTEYRLSPQEHVQENKQCRVGTLRIMPIESKSSLQTTTMHYVQQPFEEGAYTKSSWAQSPTSMFEQHLYTTLSESGLFNAVYSYEFLGKAPWVMEVRLDDFLQYFDATQQHSFVKIDATFTLYDKKTDTAVASKHFTQHIDTKSLDARGGVEALNEALGNILTDVTSWLAKSCQ